MENRPYGVANIQAIHSVGRSIVTYLGNSYPPELRAEHPCEFRLLSSGELATSDGIENALSLFLYRVTYNEAMRTSRRVNDPLDAAPPLSLDLHFLMTVWADSAQKEHTVMAWGMRQFYEHPVLDVSSLSPEAGWSPADFIQVVPEEPTNEDLMRIWDALEPGYRLSVAYVARVVRIETEFESARPAVATRFSLTDREVEP